MSKITTLVDGVAAAWNDHNASAFVAQFSEDGVLRVVATGEVVCGREELRADVEALLRAFPDLRMERTAYTSAARWFASLNGHSQGSTRVST